MSRYRYKSQYTNVIGPRHSYGNERGIALIMALMFLVVLALLTLTASTVTTLASQISGNYKASIRAFQSAEAGAEEARARLRANVAKAIYDNTVYANAALPQPPWQTYIGSTTDAQVYGYTTGNTQTRVDSLQGATPPYTVKIEHATNAGGQMLYWGDTTGTGINTRNPTLTGNPIYLVTSHGTAGGANSIVQTQVARVTPLLPPGAVYVDDNTSLLGSSTYINGTDVCPSGGTSHNVPGITTPLGTTTNGYPTISQSGHPDVRGTPTGIQYNSTLMDVQALVDSLKDAADSSYTYSATTTLARQSWGTPTAGAQQTDALSCSVSHIVYFNMMYNTSIISSLKLSGGTQGCGILLVQGNLEINGDFSWYGPVITTGMVTYTGGGHKNISGALVSGGSATVDVGDDTIGGNATILNCSKAIDDAVKSLPLRVLNWTQT